MGTMERLSTITFSVPWYVVTSIFTKTSHLKHSSILSSHNLLLISHRFQSQVQGAKHHVHLQSTPWVHHSFTLLRHAIQWRIFLMNTAWSAALSLHHGRDALSQSHLVSPPPFHYGTYPPTPLRKRTCGLKRGRHIILSPCQLHVGKGRR
jgi:hypothetical protein